MPFEVEDNGGAFVEATDGTLSIPLNTDLNVFVFDGAIEHACYSGVAGQANVVSSKVNNKVSFVAPPLPKGGPYAVRVYTVSPFVLVVTIAGEVTVRNRNFEAQVLAMRQLYSPRFRVGPRRLDIAEALP